MKDKSQGGDECLLQGMIHNLAMFVILARASMIGSRVVSAFCLTGPSLLYQSCPVPSLIQIEHLTSNGRHGYEQRGED